MINLRIRSCFHITFPKIFQKKNFKNKFLIPLIFFLYSKIFDISGINPSNKIFSYLMKKNCVKTKTGKIQQSLVINKRIH